ncbi:hypothetical protein [Rhizobium leguminosarum]
MSESMIDRVAKALCARVDGNNPTRVLRTSPVVVYEWEMYKDDAVIAIEAMRDPTEAMLQAGAIADDNFSEAAPETASLRIYGAMIDAALKEHEGSGR